MKLKQFVKVIQTLGDCKTKLREIKVKCELKQHGGFLPLLIPAVLSLLSKIIPKSNIADMAYFLVYPSQRHFNADGFRKVLSVISKLNIPRTLVPGEHLK